MTTTAKLRRLLLRSVVLPASSIVTSNKAWRSYNRYLASEYDDDDTRQRELLGRLKRTVQNAYDNLPVYKEKLRKAGVVPTDIRRLDDLARLPITTRLELDSRSLGERTSKRIEESELRFSSTSGTTTGCPLRLAHDKDSINHKYAAKLRSWSLMGGEIGAESEEGEGSTFWFTAVFKKQPEGSYVELDASGDIGGKRVLVVDDNETNRLVVKQQLLSWDCRHAEAAGGEEALDKLREAQAEKDPFDIVVLDMQMPGMDGETLGRKIKADASIRDVPLVMMSSIGQRGDAARIREVGFSAYLTKPVKQSQLYDCLASVLTRATAGEKRHVEPLVTKHSIAEGKRQKVRILVAEDNPTNQIVALKMLARLGYRADAVANGFEAVRALETIPYDLVLMDVQMPEMDGFEATERIRDPESPVRDHAIPVIAMTAHAMKGDRERCMEAGMDDYVSKPVRTQELVAVIERQLGAKADRAVQAAVVEDEVGEEQAKGPIQTSPEKPSFDESALGDRFEGDEETINAVVSTFLDDAPNQIRFLKEALETKDAEAVKQRAHSLKGASGNVGAPVLQALSLQAEDAGKAGDLDRAAAAIGEMDGAFEALKTALARHGLC